MQSNNEEKKLLRDCFYCPACPRDSKCADCNFEYMKVQNNLYSEYFKKNGAFTTSPEFIVTTRQPQNEPPRSSNKGILNNSETMKKYCYSLGDTEYYEGSFDTREEALAEAIKDNARLPKGHQVSIVYTAEEVPKTILDYFDAEELIQNMQEKADEDVSESADGWFPQYPLCLKQEVLDDLNKAISDWATKHKLQPDFYGVDNEILHNI